MKPTLVSIHHHELNGVQLIHGDEIAPGLLTGELLEAAGDGSLPPRLSIEQIHVRPDGCVVLLDWSYTGWPGLSLRSSGVQSDPGLRFVPPRPPGLVPRAKRPSARSGAKATG